MTYLKAFVEHGVVVKILCANEELTAHFAEAIQKKQLPDFVLADALEIDWDLITVFSTTQTSGKIDISRGYGGGNISSTVNTTLWFKQKPPRLQFEYITLSFSNRRVSDIQPFEAHAHYEYFIEHQYPVENALNILGNEGWECYHFEAMNSTYHLKRQVR